MAQPNDLDVKPQLSEWLLSSDICSNANSNARFGEISVNDEPLAVSVRDVSFGYNSRPILDNINISVPIGCIYGLLGASGCGKTTLLRCVLSRLKQRSGKCIIFGHESGHPKSRIPGSGAGFMPQELGLQNEFTIQETMKYFGNIYGMKIAIINERIEFLIKLLQLPKKTKSIGKLSGGERRRVSLAIALIHSPPLLILDEPTVGVDSVLRHTIWNHLIQLTNDGYTIIMTTHYIEEARSAGRVGFMRDGKILAEDDPKIMLEKFGSITLEEVFLKMCFERDSLKKLIEINKSSQCSSDVTINENENIELNVFSEPLTNNDSINGKSRKLKNRKNSNDDETINFLPKIDNYLKVNSLRGFFIQILALLGKEFIKISRNFITIVFFVIFPSVQIALLFISSGEGPNHLPIAVFNEERSGEYGDMFINSFDNKSVSIQIFNSYDEAYDDVETGNSWALIAINKRFSAALTLRKIYGIETDNETIQESLIRIYLDNSNQIVAIHLKNIIYDSMMRFAESIAIAAGTSLESIKPPIVFEDPIYGYKENRMRDFIFPAFFIILSFFGTTMATIIAIIEERNNGLTDRSIIAGVTAFQIFVSHVLVQFIILLLQIALMLIVSLIIFDMHLFGSLAIVILLMASQGFAGIIYGLMLSSICNNIITAAILAFATFFPSFIMCGVIWPLQNMPQWLQSVSLITPWTLSIDAMRSIIYRGWGLTYFHVYIGFISTYVWTLIFFPIGVYFIRRNI